jgi:nucleotide-binding universal stress UspA family protein
MPSTPYRRILVAVDFSPTSDRGIREAARIAGEDTEVTLVHAMRMLEPAIPWSSVNRKVVAKLARDAKAEARSALEKWALSLGERRTRTRVIMGGVAHEKILAEARRIRADLLIVGARGRTLSERLLIGSTAERLIRKATIPVLIVPAAPKKRR